MARVHAAPVCIVTLTYTASLDAVDALMKPHVAWLEQGLAEGLLLITGRQVPRTGGVLICRGHRAEVEAYAASDPFVAGDVATIAVVEMAAGLVADGIAPLLEG